MPGPKEEDALFEMLEALAEASGIPFGEIMASEFEEPTEPEPEFEIGELEELEDTIEGDLEVDQDYGDDVGEYLEALFDDIDVDTSENDSYADAEV